MLENGYGFALDENLLPGDVLPAHPARRFPRSWRGTKGRILYGRPAHLLHHLATNPGVLIEVPNQMEYKKACSDQFLVSF